MAVDPGAPHLADGPAYYASGPASRRRDLRALLHPPYTAWHLSLVVIGGCLGPVVNWTVLVATLLAFFLAVGVAAHCLDELHGRPLQTSIPARGLATAAVISLAGAAVIGALGVEVIGPPLAAFVVIGVALVCCYNLELFGGRLHNDLVFALGWGAFPVVVSAFAQSRAISLDALCCGAAAGLLATAQRVLSARARMLRREVRCVSGELVFADGRRERIDAAALLRPLEQALRALVFAVVALSIVAVIARAT